MPDPIIDRDAIIERAEVAMKRLFVSAGLVDLDAEDYAYDAARAALSTIADELLAPIEALHYAAYNDTDRTPLCDQCHGKAGVHECGCWADTDVQPVCGACWQGYKFVPVDWPCPTAQAVAAIREAVRA